MNHVKQQGGKSFWQSQGWSDILLASHQAHRVEHFSHAGITILIEFRTLGLGQIGAFSLGVDGVCIDPVFFERGSEMARRYGAIFWQIEYLHAFPVPVSWNFSIPYKHFLEPYTRVLDLTLDDTSLLTQMHEKGRYNIRLAEKRGVIVEWVTATPENIDIWMALLSDTTARDGFAHNSREYYKAFLRDSDTMSLAFARFEGSIIAAGIFVYGPREAIYYYGASSSDPEMRKHMAPYLLQWFAISEAKKRGCITYDFLGIAPPGSIDDRLAGVSAFKEKFGGSVQELGPKILIPLSWKYSLFSFLRGLRK